MIKKSVKLKDVRLRVMMPLETSARFRFIRMGQCYELDVLWMTSESWWRRPDRHDWSTRAIGPFVLAMKLVV